jgi:hypothetical protein
VLCVVYHCVLPTGRLSDVFGIVVFLGLTPLSDKGYWRRCIERPLKNRSDSGLKALKVSALSPGGGGNRVGGGIWG